MKVSDYVLVQRLTQLRIARTILGEAVVHLRAEPAGEAIGMLKTLDRLIAADEAAAERLSR